LIRPIGGARGACSTDDGSWCLPTRPVAASARSSPTISKAPPFHDHQDGVPVYRVIAYGALSGGSGALEGAGGVLLMDAAVSASGGAPSVYTVWLSDARGRFRA
jgi:hypothetical protein